MLVKTCVVCGKEFRYRSGEERTCCGEACGHLARRKPPVERACEVCGKTFLVGPFGYGYASWSARRCSVACRRVGRMRKSATSLPLSVADAAYLAGLIDGEGSISIRSRARGSVVVQLTITNTHHETLNWCKTITGVGAVIPMGRPSHHRDCWYWAAPTGSGVSVLRQVRPYLKIKAAQAALAIDVQDRLTVPAFKADLTWQLEWRAQMQALNKRGPKSLTLTAGG